MADVPEKRRLRLLQAITGQPHSYKAKTKSFLWKFRRGLTVNGLERALHNSGPFQMIFPSEPLPGLLRRRLFVATKHSSKAEQ